MPQPIRVRPQPTTRAFLRHVSRSPQTHRAARASAAMAAAIAIAATAPPAGATGTSDVGPGGSGADGDGGVGSASSSSSSGRSSSSASSPSGGDDDAGGDDDGGDEPAAALTASPPPPGPNRNPAVAEAVVEVTSVPLDVVVTGTRTLKRAEDSPVRTLVVSRELMDRRQARALSDALQYLPGVRVENNCQNCGFTQLRLNGLDGPYTQVLIDGLPSYSPLTGVYGLEQLPSEMLERVEVVKGGASSLYGPGAIAGVVHLVTRRPDRDYVSLRIQRDAIGARAAGTRGAAYGGVVTEDGRHGGHVYATAFQQSPYDRDGDGYSETVRLRTINGGGNAILTVGDNSELRLGLHGLIENRRGGDAFDVPPHEAELAESIDTRRLQSDVRWRQEVNRYVDYQLSYTLAYVDRSTYYGGGGRSSREALARLGPPDPDWPQARFDAYDEALEARAAALGAYGETDNALHVADAAVNVRFSGAGEHVLTLGLQGQADRIEDRYLGYARVIDDTFAYLGAYLQHDWVPASWVELVVGARVDQHTELSDPIASPRAALLFRPVDGLRLRSAFSTGFRAPQAFDEDLHIESVAGAPRIIRNDPDLAPERGMSFAQQIEGRMSAEGGFRLVGSINGYYQRLDQAFVLDTEDVVGTPELEVVRVNRGLTQVYGAEVNARVSYRDLTALRAGLTLENGFNDEPDPDFGVTRLFRTPRAYGYFEWLLT
ncbi:MAG: TonB-dependent receptor, partial [Myxococcota bacterium]